MCAVLYLLFYEHGGNARNAVVFIFSEVANVEKEVCNNHLISYVCYFYYRINSYLLSGFYR